MTVKVRPLAGAALADGLKALADLRIRVFRDWPYLYDGDADYERRYLGKFAAGGGGIIAAAFDGDTIVGAATAAPMAGHFGTFAEPFEKAGYDIDRIFYFGESVLLPDYRGQGIGHRFFEEREAAARRAGRYDLATFCAVVRPADHPLRDTEYRPLDPFWRKRGFRPADGLVARFSWKDIGDEEETEKPMQFWVKEL